MKIEHVAIYAKNLEALRDFYVKYFQAISNEMYENPKKGFRSYFLSFLGGSENGAHAEGVDPRIPE